MDCPKCSKGKIRVYTLFACTCGHHPLVCDGCAQQFNVPHASPPGALPPDVPLEENEEHRAAYEEMVKVFGDNNAQSYEEMTKAEMATVPDCFPLLEDFKASQSS